MIHAMSGIDLALWDIKGKALGLPVWKLLGGGFRRQLRAYASNMFEFTRRGDRRAGAARRGARASPRSSSAGTRWARTPKTDVALVASRARGRRRHRPDDRRRPGLRRQDRHPARAPFEQYDPSGSRSRCCRTTRRLRQARGRHRSGSPPARRRAAAGFTRLMDVGKIDVVQVDLTRCGLTEAMKIAALRRAARAAGRQPRVHDLPQRRRRACTSWRACRTPSSWSTASSRRRSAARSPRTRSAIVRRPCRRARGAGPRRRARPGDHREVSGALKQAERELKIWTERARTMTMALDSYIHLFRPGEDGDLRSAADAPRHWRR